MATRTTRSARHTTASSSSSSQLLDEASLAEPHEYRNAEQTLTKLLHLMRRGVLPANLVPALNTLHDAVIDAPCFSCHLLNLSHDELGVIFDGLADPLRPVVAVALSSTCKGLRTPLQAALEVLQERHVKAKALCQKTGTSYWQLRDAKELEWEDKDLADDDMVTLGMMLPWMPGLCTLDLDRNQFGDVGAQALFEGLGPAAAPSLAYVWLCRNLFGPAGAEALSAALRRGAMPKLEQLDLSDNLLGNQGVAALAVPLRQLPALDTLFLNRCNMGDDGLASLLAGLGSDGFKLVTELYLDGNQLTDAGCATLIASLKAGALPEVRAIKAGLHFSVHASNEMLADLDAALNSLNEARRSANARRN